MLSKMLRGSVNNTTNPALPTDSNFKQVSLLLHGDGTNGAQNNTFLDSSTNNFTITRNGNTTQGTNTPFSQAAGYWSNRFNGTTDYLGVPTNTALDLGSSNFTAEAWVYPAASITSPQFVIGSWNGTTDLSWYFGILNTNALYFTLSTTGSYNSSNDVISSNNVINPNAWNHIALVRNGNVYTMYANGVSVGTLTLSGALFSRPNNTQVGANSISQYFNGYISNARIVVGTAVYTSAFTPATTPLTAITNTKLLTCQSSYFVDNSSNNFTLTATGTPSVQPFSPFAPTSAYSTSVNGGSMYFDGSGDNVYVSSISLPSDFTLECWIYTLSTADQVVSSGGGNANNQLFRLNYPSTGLLSYFLGTAPVYDSGTACIFPNQWTHLALSRTGSTCNLYVNGVLFNTNTTTGSFTFGNVGCLFSTSQQNYFTGYISNYRCIAGTGLYPSAFTPPTAPLTAITNTQLLLNGTNAGIYDNAIKNDLETVGSAQVSTSVVKYGTGSMKFNGTTDYLTAPTSPQFAFGTGAWTIEGWVYSSSVTVLQSLIDTRATATSTTGVLVSITALGFISVTVNNAILFTSSTAMTLSTWVHVAVVQNGTTITLYLDGTKPTTGSGTSSTSLTDQYLRLGASAGTAANFYNGYLDDVRITKGIARYTANFTAPTSAFPNQ